MINSFLEGLRQSRLDGIHLEIWSTTECVTCKRNQNKLHILVAWPTKRKGQHKLLHLPFPRFLDPLHNLSPQLKAPIDILKKLLHRSLNTKHAWQQAHCYSLVTHAWSNSATGERVSELIACSASCSFLRWKWLRMPSSFNKQKTFNRGKWFCNTRSYKNHMNDRPSRSQLTKPCIELLAYIFQSISFNLGLVLLSGPYKSIESRSHAPNCMEAYSRMMVWPFQCFHVAL